MSEEKYLDERGSVLAKVFWLEKEDGGFEGVLQYGDIAIGLSKRAEAGFYEGEREGIMLYIMNEICGRIFGEKRLVETESGVLEENKEFKELPCLDDKAPENIVSFN